MSFFYTDALERHNWLGGGSYANVYHVAPTIAVKTVRHDRSPQETGEHPLINDIAFYRRLHKRQDKCQSILECFLMLPDQLFLLYCANKTLQHRIFDRQEREPGKILGSVIHVKDYEDPALVAQWTRQLTSALEYVEKMGFCHNDLQTTNCLLDESLNLKLSDFGCATTIGQELANSFTWAPKARLLTTGPLKGTYGLCSSRTEQFAVGSILYSMVYGHDPYEDTDIDMEELEHRFAEMKFPELSRHENFDSLIAGCWYDVFPNMALLAYSSNRTAKEFAPIAEYTTIDHRKEKRTCEAVIQRGILGPELALCFQPAWKRYLYAARNMPWRIFVGLPRRLRFWSWFWC